jgi:Xaa-Pro aminopeptidase
MRIAPADVLYARVAAVAAELSARQLDALLVTNLSSVAYLTGFFASAAAAIVSRSGVTLIGDGRYAEALAARERECEFVLARLLQGSQGYDAAIIDLLARHGAARVGFEAAHLTVSRYTFLLEELRQAAPGITLASTEGLVERPRCRKDAWELATLREGAARLSDVAKCILPKALAGRTEAEVAADIEQELRRAGFDRPAFDTIVAAGPHAASPHARAGQRRIERGELVILDFGGVLDGYCTDLTRTVAAGGGGHRERQLVEQVIEAQAAAFGAVRPGAQPEDVDGAARRVLTAHGLGEAFTHGTGHGLGLDVHEAPRVSPPRPPRAEPPLAAGMVMTLEPGAYFPGWGGVRIEDDVLVTEDGAEWLTDVPRAV